MLKKETPGLDARIDRVASRTQVLLSYLGQVDITSTSKNGRTLFTDGVPAHSTFTDEDHTNIE